MNIVLVSPYALSVFGGVQEQVLAMSRELVERGHEVTVVAPGKASATMLDTPATVIGLGRVTSVPANGSKAPVSLGLAAARQLAAFVRSRHPDVVHLHEPFAPTLGWSTLRRHEAPIVATFHRSGMGPDITVGRPLLRRFARSIDAAASVSASAQSTAHLGYGIDTTVLFNGFDVDRFRTFERTVPTQPRLLVVGRLEERKGVAVAIRAVLAHNDRCAPEDRWYLDVAGGGPERGSLERMAEHSPCISFLGAISDEEKRRRLRQATAVLCPALFGESFGLVLLEAMAAGVPVVASDIDGYRQASGGHGFLFAPNDEHDLCRAVEQAMDQSSAATAAATAHAEAWSMRTLVGHYEELYRKAKAAFESR